MTDSSLDTIILPTGGSGFAPRPPAPDDVGDCPPCEERRRQQTRAALVEFRRALKMLDGNAQALIVALDLEC